MRRTLSNDQITVTRIPSPRLAGSVVKPVVADPDGTDGGGGGPDGDKSAR